MALYLKNLPQMETITLTDVHLNDNTTAAYDLILDSDSDSTVLTIDRTLTFDVNNANRTIDLSGDLTLSGANTVATWASTGAIEANSAGATGEIGIDFNSISSTYSTICQSDAEGISANSDLRIGLDETLRTMIICDRGDIATDFGLATSADPRLLLYDATGASSTQIKSSQYYSEIKARYSLLFEIDQGSALWRFDTDLGSGNSFEFKSNANIRITDADAEQAWMYLEPKINQTSTANYVGLLMDVTETGTGSGVNELMALRVAAADKFTVDNKGYTKAGSLSASLADNAVFTTTIPDTWTGLVVVSNVTDTTSGVYHLDGTAITAINQNAAFTVTQGTDNKTNVYVTGNVLTVENTQAAAKTVKVMFVGT